MDQDSGLTGADPLRIGHPIGSRCAAIELRRRTQPSLRHIEEGLAQLGRNSLAGECETFVGIGSEFLSL